MGIPTILIGTDAFEGLARMTAEAFGFPDLRMVILPHPVNVLDNDRLRELARSRVPEILEKLAEER